MHAKAINIPAALQFNARKPPHARLGTRFARVQKRRCNSNSVISHRRQSPRHAAASPHASMQITSQALCEVCCVHENAFCITTRLDLHRRKRVVARITRADARKVACTRKIFELGVSSGSSSRVISLRSQAAGSPHGDSRNATLTGGFHCTPCPDRATNQSKGCASFVYAIAATLPLSAVQFA